MSILLAMAAFLSAPSAVQVDVGRAEWSNFPPLQRSERQLPTSAMVAVVAEILRERRCTLPGQRARRFDIDVPYLVKVGPDGSASRIVVADIGCPALETFVGQIVTALARDGDFRPTGERQDRWYASSINFNLLPN